MTRGALGIGFPMARTNCDLDEAFGLMKELHQKDRDPAGE